MTEKEPRHRDTMLGEEEVGPLLFKLSLPGIVGMLSHAFYNLVDTIYIGRGVGTDAIGGLAVAFPFQMLVVAFAGVIGIGAASMVSRNLGAGRRDYAYQSAANAFVLSVILGLTCSIFGLTFLNQLLRLFGATETLLSYSRDYLSIILTGTVFGTFAMVSNSLVRSEGRAVIAMGTMLAGTAINLILDPIFIFGLDMGIRGAAMATIMAQATSALFLLWFYLSKRSSLEIKLRHFKINPAIVREVISIGIPSFVRQSGSSIMLVVLNNVLGKYGGDLYISLLGIINRFFMMVFMSIVGIVFGLQPIVGYNYGARKIGRVKEALKKSSFAATVICTSIFFVLMIFPGQMVGIFSDDPELIQVSIRAVRYIVLAMPLVGFQIIASSFFQAIGKGRPALLLSMSRQFLLLIPFVLILPAFLGVTGVFFAFPLADGLSFLLTAYFFRIEVKLMNELPG